MNGGWGISYEIALRWMPLDLTDGKSTLVQVMAWCRQATSHYLSQCWPRSMSPNGVTRPQWVKPQQNANCTHISGVTEFKSNAWLSLKHKPNTISLAGKVGVQLHFIFDDYNWYTLLTCRLLEAMEWHCQWVKIMSINNLASTKHIS